MAPKKTTVQVRCECVWRSHAFPLHHNGLTLFSCLSALWESIIRKLAHKRSQSDRIREQSYRVKMLCWTVVKGRHTFPSREKREGRLPYVVSWLTAERQAESLGCGLSVRETERETRRKPLREWVDREKERGKETKRQKMRNAGQSSSWCKRSTHTYTRIADVHKNFMSSKKNIKRLGKGYRLGFSALVYSWHSYYQHEQHQVSGKGTLIRKWAKRCVWRQTHTEREQERSWEATRREKRREELKAANNHNSVRETHRVMSRRREEA